MSWWGRFIDWSDSDAAALPCLIVLIATLGIAAGVPYLSWASSLYGVGMYWLTYSLSKESIRKKNQYRDFIVKTTYKS